MDPFAALALAVSAGKRREARRVLARLVEEKGVGAVEAWALRNDIAYTVRELALEAGLDELAERLEKSAERVEEAARHTAELMELVDKTLARGGIGYTVFKTFNRIGRVDVDVDMIIYPKDYWQALRLLHGAGLKPIDSVKKTYATGLMAPGNPIVLDVHTELTVLGIPYIDNTILLENNERKTHKLPGGHLVEAYTATPLADTVARIGHAIIKEAEIKIDDVTETIHVTTRHRKTLRKILEAQGIPEAYNEYLKALLQALKNMKTPLRLDRRKSIELIIARITRRHQPVLLLEAALNLRYPRNAAHIAHLALNTLS